MENRLFEWDEKKRAQNIEKHGIDFLKAVEIFEKEYLVALSPYLDEERWIAVGKMQEITIAVIYTVRGEVTRIISVRRARKNERRKYQALYH